MQAQHKQFNVQNAQQNPEAWWPCKLKRISKHSVTINPSKGVRVWILQALYKKTRSVGSHKGRLARGVGCPETDKDYLKRLFSRLDNSVSSPLL